MRVHFAFLGLALSLGGCDAPPQAPAKPALVAEMRARPVHAESFLACVSQDDLHAAQLHAARKEKTKFDAMIVDSRCLVAPGGETYKVLSVTGDDVEFTGLTSGMSDGLWASSDALEPAPSK